MAASTLTYTSVVAASYYTVTTSVQAVTLTSTFAASTQVITQTLPASTQVITQTTSAPAVILTSTKAASTVTQTSVQAATYYTVTTSIGAITLTATQAASTQTVLVTATATGTTSMPITATTTTTGEHNAEARMRVLAGLTRDLVTYTPPAQYQPAQTVVQTVTATAVSSVSYGITSTTTVTGEFAYKMRRSYELTSKSHVYASTVDPYPDCHRDCNGHFRHLWYVRSPERHEERC